MFIYKASTVTLSGHLTLPVYPQRGRYTNYHQMDTEQQKDSGAVPFVAMNCRCEDMLHRGEEEEKFSAEVSP